MNKQELLEQLSQYLQEYGNYNFKFCSEFVLELRDLLSQNVNNHNLFFSQFTTALHNIRDYKHNIYTIDSHEKPKNCGFSCYSIHLESKSYNIRFLISFLSDDSPIFLTAFYERQGKTVSSYKKYIPKAKQRYEEIRRLLG